MTSSLSATPAAESPAVRAARVELAAAFRICFRYGFHEAIDNHLSLLVPGSPTEMLVNPLLHWSELRASDLARIDVSTPPAPDGPVDPTAYHVHAPVHRARPEAFRCVMHTHMPHATAIACREQGRVVPLHQHFLSLHDKIAYLDSYAGEVLDDRLGEEIARAMGERPLCLLACHGVIAAGPSVAVAFERLYYLERACQFQILAEAGGHTPRRIPDAVLESPGRRAGDPSWDAHAEHHFAALLRWLDREDPSYRD